MSCLAPMKGSENEARLDGRLVVITGANTGIGKVTALDMSKRGARVIMLCRSLDKAKEACADIAKEAGGAGGAVECEKLDLASLASVRECATKLLNREEKIDLLINNAGVMTCPNWKTEDGFDMQLGTNHLGHFLLTELLLPLLKKSAASGFRPRIVIVSSVAHTAATSMHWEDLNWEKSYDKNRAYAQSKLANVLHAKELARRLKDEGISVFSLHPGVIDSELWRHQRQAWYGRLWAPIIMCFFKTELQGAQTTIYCCVEESIENRSGGYFSDCKEVTPSRAARSEEKAKKLWEMSENLVGLSS